VLAIATRTIPPQSSYESATIETDLTLLGFVAMIDPSRAGTTEAFAFANEAHIKTVVITGDNPFTARAIAERIGIASKGATILLAEGRELSAWSDEQLLAQIQKAPAAIFARVSPEEKLRVFSVLKNSGQVVAVTGDGVNDALAIKRADIGVAMGRIGTDTVKEAAQIVLMDDSYATLIKVDNCATTIGSTSQKRNLSRVMRFLLSRQVNPIFSVPHKPFSQASIEGNNSIFSRKFWNRLRFKNLKEVDRKLEWFNLASAEYCGYRRSTQLKKKTKKFIPKVYFLRQVQTAAETRRVYIEVLHEKIFLPSAYLHYFVLAEWNLKKEKLLIRFEKEQKSRVIKELVFKINWGEEGEQKLW
jgi:soluble P-type ATPase